MVLGRKSLVVRAGAAGLVSVGLLASAYAASSAGAAGSPVAPVSTLTPNLIKNSDFSPGAAFSGATVARSNGTGAHIAGWVVGGGGVQIAATSFVQAPGTLAQSVALEGPGGPGTITQTVKTAPGTTYLLQWYGAGEPGPQAPTVKTMHVLWNGTVVASPNFNTAGYTTSKMGWSLNKVAVTATSTSSTVEFVDSMPATSTYAALVADASLAGDAQLYLPKTATLAASGKLTALVRNPNNTPLHASGLTVKLYASIAAASYAPPTNELLASAPVVNGQAVLQLKLSHSLAGKTISAYATLQGANYATVTDKLTIKII